MTHLEAVKFMESHGFRVHLEFDTQTAQVNDWKPMYIDQFVAYVTGFKEGMHWGYEGIAP
jgi:hypothetical protein